MVARGYPSGKNRGGQTDRQKSNGGPGKNAQHGDGGHHSQTPKGNKPAKGGANKGSKR